MKIKEIKKYLKELGFKRTSHKSYIEYRIKNDIEDYYFSFYSNTIFYSNIDLTNHWTKSSGYDGLLEFIKINPDFICIMRKYKISLLNG